MRNPPPKKIVILKGTLLNSYLIKKNASLPILRKFSLYSKPKLIYAGRLDSLRYNFSEKR
jgi:hypothetical protein